MHEHIYFDTTCLLKVEVKLLADIVVIFLVEELSIILKALIPWFDHLGQKRKTTDESNLINFHSNA